MSFTSLAQATVPVRPGKGEFPSGGKEIHVEIFTPATPGKHAAIIVLHGAGGIFADGPALRRYAQTLVTHGFEAFLVHYMERTGTLFARDASIHKNFAAWHETVNDAVNYVFARPDIDSERIGCFGYSLGAYLSLAQAAHDPRIGAVVELAGAVDREHDGLVTRMPPTLILHGSEDQRVATYKAYDLAKLLTRLGVVHELHIYDGEGHGLSPSAQADVAQRGVRFFQKVRAH